MKKAMALLLSLAMLLALVTACGSKSATTSSAASSSVAASASKASSSAAGSSSASSAASSAASGKLCDEKTTLTVFTYDAVNNTYPAPSNDLKFWKWLEDYTNVHIEWNITPISGFDEVVNTKLASGSDIDDIFLTQNLTNNNEAGENGIFENMSDYWDTCFTNTKDYFDGQGINYKSMLSNEDGSMYAITGSVEPVEGHIILMYNTEWMKKLGATVPKTLDEFTALLQKMKDAGDLNGNGQDDEVVLTSAGTDVLASVLGNAFGLEQYEGWDAFVADGSGKVHDEYTTDNMKNYLSYTNDLYSKGLLDSEICTMTADALSEKIAADRVGVFVYYSAFAITYGKLTSAGVSNPSSEHYTLGYPLASSYNNNDARFIKREKLTGGGYASVSSKCKNKELAMKWLDTLLADPTVLKARTCGFEGEDWKTGADGNIELIYPTSGSAWDISKKGCGQISLPFIQTKDQLLNSKRQFQWYMDEYDDLRSNCKWVSPSVARVSSYTDAEKEKVDASKTDVTTYWKEMRDKFVKGEASLSGDWDTYVSTMNKLGLPTWTEAWQSIYERTK